MGPAKMTPIWDQGGLVWKCIKGSLKEMSASNRLTPPVFFTTTYCSNWPRKRFCKNDFLGYLSSTSVICLGRRTSMGLVRTWLHRPRHFGDLIFADDLGILGWQKYNSLPYVPLGGILDLSGNQADSILETYYCSGMVGSGTSRAETNLNMEESLLLHYHWLTGATSSHRWPP